MAGGKETPRQKLINLMYLVLLALLALQVSSAIMEKFLFLENSLKSAKDGAVGRNVKVMQNIEGAVAERGNRADEKKIVDEAASIRKQTNDILVYIDTLKSQLVRQTGGYDDHGQYVGAKLETEVEVLMCGPEGQKNGKGYELKKKLDQYYVDLMKIVPENIKDKFHPLALDAKDDPLFKDKADQKGKDYVELNFAQTPMCAVMAVMADKQNQVATYEALILAELAKKVGSSDYKAGKIFPKVAAKSQIVAAGLDYEADMFITAEITGVIPTMKFRGSPIKVENNIGKIKFKASASTYDKEGNSESTWQGSITVKKPTGGDTTYTVTEKYIVAKPVIDVKSSAVSALYKDCANELNIQVPALGSSYKPAFSVTNATSRPGAEKGSITVVPSSLNTVKISVSSDGAAIGFKEFGVKPVPPPAVMAMAGSREANLRTGEKANTPSITIKIKPESGFESALPKEARYEITDGKVQLIRGRRPAPGSERKLNPNGVVRVQDLNPQVGDVLYIEIIKLNRINTANNKIEVPLGLQSSIVRIPLGE
ncbi:MAG: gliding motility protein GldM [Bacteroidota bacterium]